MRTFIYRLGCIILINISFLTAGAYSLCQSNKGPCQQNEASNDRIVSSPATTITTPLRYDETYQAQLVNSTYSQTIDDSFNQLLLWIPLWQRPNDVLFFQFDLRNNFKAQAGYGLNVGYRWLNDLQNTLVGLSAGLTQQHSATGNKYQQINFGTELRTKRWHGYTNAYLPISTTKRETSHDIWEARSTDNPFGFYNIATKVGEEKALHGGDANLGYTVLEALNGKIYFGGYYYAAKGVKPISGPQIQFQIDLFNAFKQYKKTTWLSKVTLLTSYTHDHVHKNNLAVGIQFSINLGKSQQLPGITEYMQSAIQQNYSMKIRPNDAVDPTLFTNENGSALTVGYVDDIASLNNAVNNGANIIAVRSQLDNLDTINLQAGQVLTGGAYQLNNGVTVNLGNNGQLSAANGQNLLQVTRDNHIEDIILHADPGQYVIVNNLNDSYGTLRINNIQANAGVNLAITDGREDSNLLFTNNTFNMGSVNNKAALQVLIDSGKSHLSITDNKINFANGSGNKAINLDPELPENNILHYQIDAIDNNVIQFENGDRNIGINLNIVDGPTGFGKLTVDSLQNNKIYFLTGDDNFGMNVSVESLSGNGAATINNILNNYVSFSGGNNNNAYNFSVALGDGIITLNKVINNNVTLPASGNNQGFFFITGPDSNKKIIINVENGQKEFSASNPDTPYFVSPNSNVVFRPDE